MAFNNIDVVAVVLIVLSVIFYFLFLLVESANFLNIDDILGVFNILMSDPSTYFTLLFILLFTYTIEKLFYFAGVLID